MVCFPLCIRESTQNGRQYLIYYHPEFRSISALRMDFIEKIHIGDIKKASTNIKEDLNNALMLLDYTNGVQFDGFAYGNVKNQPILHTIELLVCIEGEKEDVIRNRIRREIFRHTDTNEVNTEQYGKCIEITITAVNISEVIAWAKTFIRRIIYLKIDGIESAYGLAVSDLFKLYTGKRDFNKQKIKDALKI